MIVPGAINVPDDSVSDTAGVPDEHEVIVSVVVVMPPRQVTLPTGLVALYGAQFVPVSEHTSIGWTATYWVIGTWATAAPEARQAAANNRKRHAVRLRHHLKSHRSSPFCWVRQKCSAFFRRSVNQLTLGRHRKRYFLRQPQEPGM